jgi:hypothetical protein
VSGSPRAAVTLLLVAAAAGEARAGGLDLDLFGTRSIGRAGTAVVSGDGGTSILVNPAGLARRSETRAQFAIALHDDDSTYQTPDAGAENSPIVRDRAQPVSAPSVGLATSLGPVVLGAAVMVAGSLERTLPAPQVGQPPADVERLFPHRYGGLELDFRRRIAVVGAATRIGESLGVGIAAGAADVTLGERRRLWAGFAGRTADEQVGAAAWDVDLSLRATDSFVPLAAAGVLVAPPQLPIEMAAALTWSADAWPDGEASLIAAGDSSPLIYDSGADAEVRIAGPTVLRTGLRYLGERFIAELAGELVWHREAGKLPDWHLQDLAVEDIQSGRVDDIERVPSLAAVRNHSAVRGAVDVEVVRGLLWLTTGYAFSTAATARAQVSPAFGDTGGHTLAIGAEATWNLMTVTLGYARLIAATRTVGGDDTAVDVVNPFDAGTAPAAPGRHGRAHDAVGLAIEVAWE